MHIILSFFIYSFLGWLCECIYCGIPAKKFINRGFLAGPYCPIYGCGAIAVILLLEPFDTSFPLLFLMGIIITSALEYLTSYLMEIIFHTKWWDYSSYPYNLHGRICLKNSLLFGLMVLFVYYGIHPTIQHMIDSIPLPLQSISVIVISAIFLYDLVNTTLALLHKNKDFLEVETCMRILYDDFKHAQFHPGQERLHDMVQRVLDSTDADEILMEHIEKFKGKMEILHTHHKKTQKRLSNAFPTMKETISKLDAESAFKLLNEYRRKKGK